MFYLIIKLLWYLLRILIFKIIVDNFVDFIVDSDLEIKKKKENNNNKPAHLEKNKEVELVEVEKIKNQQENIEDIEQNNIQISTPKIVGIKIEVKGKFTQAIANKMRINFQNLDRNVLLKQGYWEAFVGLQKKQQTIQPDKFQR